MNAEELAKKLADHFNPPHWESRRRRDLREKELRKLPFEERYEEVWVEYDGDRDTMTVFVAEDGYKAIRSLRFSEIAEAAVKILEENDS